MGKKKEKTEVKDSKDVKVEEEEKSKVDQKDEKIEVVVEDDEKIYGEDDVKVDVVKVNDVKVDDVKDVVKVDDVDDDVKVDVVEDDVKVDVVEDDVKDVVKVDDVKVDVVEDDVKVDDVKMDSVDDLKVKVKDMKVKDVMMQQGIDNKKKKKFEDDNDDFKLYNTSPKGKFGRRVRKPKTDDSYTNPSLSKLPKTNDPMKVNPLQKFEDELLDKVKEWLDDPKTNDVKKDVATCEVGNDMFVKVLTRLTWLEDTEIDAFCQLLRKKIAEYHKTYKNSKVTKGNCVLADRLRREYMTFSKDPANYPVEEFKDYYMGVEHRYMPEWSTIYDIYVLVNISQKHWILCVARLQKNRIDVYDCDAYIYKNLDPYLKPLCEMLPHVFARTVTKGEMKRFPHFNFQAMTYKWFPNPKVKTIAVKVGEVLRVTESGDCGVFTLMYMEYLTINQGV
ncbi:reticulocyte-binding protein homolog 1-like [Impatiens glandulifera]|uniref:reticulocyte-binding protein homolog 1-like n=1 Tax=Impatiens glandulifera TaxID=253017 RepID=UPI001FB11BAD|nr:reticulocyte-binding protein homolog 1-like [Impatiens glandulifera]